jgi:hypothetical protein
MSFAVVELMYRRFQLRFILRSKRLEEMLATGDLSGYEYDVHRSATGQRGDCSLGTELKAVLKQPQFTAFYLILSTFAVVCTFYAHYWLGTVVGDLNM